MPVLPNGSLEGAVGNGTVLSQLGSGIGSSLLGSVGLSKASNRKNVSDMFRYSDSTRTPNASISFPDASADWRVRISLAPNADYFYADSSNSLLSPLMTDPGNGLAGAAQSFVNYVAPRFGYTPLKRIGVVFPYTPTIAVTHTATYEAQKLVHNNYTQHMYNNSDVGAITITAEFTVQNINEGQYLMACIYFFRSCTKMFFGKDKNAGNPPPIVYLNGYGQYYLPNVPCVVTSFSHTMPAEVDYMDIPEPAATLKGYNPQAINYRLNSTRMPTTSSMVLSLQPVYSRLAQSQGFSLTDFSKGALINPASSSNRATSFGASQAPSNVPNSKSGGFL